MKSKFCGNKLFSVGMIFFLMLLISACTSSSGTTPLAGGYSISGVVTGDATDVTGRAVAADALPGLQGVTMTLGGDGTGTATTGADGSYSFAGLGNGTYTVIPSMAGHTFNEVSKVIVVNGAPAPETDFEAITGVGYEISGRVCVEPAAGIGIGSSPAGVIACTSKFSSALDIIVPIDDGLGLAGVKITLSRP